MAVQCREITGKSRRLISGALFSFIAAVLIILVMGTALGVSAASRAEENISTVCSGSPYALSSLSPTEVLALALQRCRSLDSYRCHLTLHLTRGDRVQNSEYVFSYKKPNLVRMEVKNGKDKGSTVILRADGRIRGRREGLLSVFPITLRPDDDRLYDLWNRSFRDSDWVTLLRETGERLKDTNSACTQIVDDGQKILLVAQADSLVEKTWLDSDQLVLVRKQARRDNGDSLDAVWSDIALNPIFDDDFFNF